MWSNLSMTVKWTHIFQPSQRNHWSLFLFQQYELIKTVTMTKKFSAVNRQNHIKVKSNAIFIHFTWFYALLQAQIPKNYTHKLHLLRLFANKSCSILLEIWLKRCTHWLPDICITMLQCTTINTNVSVSPFYYCKPLLFFSFSLSSCISAKNMLIHLTMAHIFT